MRAFPTHTHTSSVCFLGAIGSQSCTVKECVLANLQFFLQLLSQIRVYFELADFFQMGFLIAFFTYQRSSISPKVSHWSNVLRKLFSLTNGVPIGQRLFGLKWLCVLYVLKLRFPNGPLVASTSCMYKN